MTNQDRVCGDIFYEGFRAALGDEPTQADVNVWHYGFSTGQAEKVYLGACHGCMFRIGEKWRKMCLVIDNEVATRYGLEVRLWSDEIWLLNKQEGVKLFEMMRSQPENSPAWHIIRGQICGVPDKEIDTRFHFRKGYKGRTD